jgi:hypothetical protein
MSGAERRQLVRLGLAIAGLHVAGAGMLLAVAGPGAGAKIENLILLDST